MVTINIGDIIQANDMKLRVVGKCGGALQCEYWDAVHREWKIRGVSENAKRIAERIESGAYRFRKEM